MKLCVGLDVGATSLKLAALGASLREFCQKSEPAPFRRWAIPADRPEGDFVLVSNYRRIQGNPLQAVYDLLSELEQWAGAGAIKNLLVTGSGGRRAASLLGCGYENEFRALAKGVRLMHPEVRTIFEMGGAHAFNTKDKEIYWKDQTVRYHQQFATDQHRQPGQRGRHRGQDHHGHRHLGAPQACLPGSAGALIVGDPTGKVSIPSFVFYKGTVTGISR